MYCEEGEVFFITWGSSTAEEYSYIYGAQVCYKIHNDSYFTLKYDPRVKQVMGFQGDGTQISILEWSDEVQ